MQVLAGQHDSVTAQLDAAQKGIQEQLAANLADLRASAIDLRAARLKVLHDMAEVLHITAIEC
jgi:hypothetical protein